MLTPQNHSDNNILAAYSAKAPKPVLSAIKTASAKTGVDFAYMVQQAEAESAFKPNAQAKTSSARGLYQFIESTWLSMVDKHGASYGIETEGQSRSDILKLRDNPEIASFMAAELARDNQNVLERNWAKGEKEIGATELYFAHFLGAGGASAFMNARDEDGSATAAHIFPKAANANKNVFYDRATGHAKSLDDVYAFFDNKFDLDKTLEHHAPITVLNGKLRLLQAPDGFRTSIDAVLLAAACPAQNGHSILDLGCGVGSAGLCALHRLPAFS